MAFLAGSLGGKPSALLTPNSESTKGPQIELEISTDKRTASLRLSVSLPRRLATLRQRSGSSHIEDFGATGPLSFIALSTRLCTNFFTK